MLLLTDINLIDSKVGVMNKSKNQEDLERKKLAAMRIQTANPGVSLAVAITNQSGRNGTVTTRSIIPKKTNNTTIIRPSAGTTTDIIIRPAIFDTSGSGSPQPRLPTAPGKTQIISFPATGSFKNLQVEQETQYVYEPVLPVQFLPPTSNPIQSQQRPSLPPTLQSYPMTTLLPVPATSQGQTQGQFYNPTAEGVQSSSSRLGGSSPQPSPYNFQNQRAPLPVGVWSNNGKVSRIMVTDGDTQVDDIIYTNGNDQNILQHSSDLLYKKCLADMVLGIQMLAEDSLPDNLIEGLQALANTEHIFVEPATATFTEASITTANKFNLLDSYGNRLFFAFEKRYHVHEGLCDGCCSDPHIRFSVTDVLGVEYMSLQGNTGIVAMRSYGPDDTLHTLGYIVEEQHLCSLSNSYAIKNKFGNLSFKLIHEGSSNECPTELTILGNDMVKIGNLSKFWGQLPDASLDLSHSYGIRFPSDMNMDEKGLMLGALITIYWKYYADKTRNRRIARNAWCCAMACIALILLTILGFAFIGAYVIHKSL